MSSLAHVTDHEARMFARFVERLKPVKGFRGLLDVFTVQVQEIEDVLWTLYTTTALNGSGYQLDVLGRLLREPREGFDDAEYLTRLKAKIRVLRSNGNASDLLGIFKLLLPGNKIYFSAIGGASFILEIGDANGDYADIYSRFLHEAKSAGINGQAHYTALDGVELFEMDFGSTLYSGAPSGQTYFTPVSWPVSGVGGLVVLSPGMSVGETRVIASGAPVDTVGVTPALSNSHSANTAASYLGAAGTFGQLTAAANSGTTLVTMGGGHPFVADETVLLGQGTSLQEQRTVVSITATSITVTPALTSTHPSGSHATKRPQNGWGTLSDSNVGGRLSGVIV